MGGEAMHRYDYFSGATWDWRTRVAMRMRQVLDDHPGDALVYIEKCIRRAHWASFEKRRWRQIRQAYYRQLSSSAQVLA